MTNQRIYLKKGLQLRKVGKQHMIVEASEENVNMSNVYSLNTTAARLWELIAENPATTAEQLVDYLCDNYEIDKATATGDVERLLAEWKSYGLII